MCPILPPPPGTWCNVPCNGAQTACSVLDAIQAIAEADKALNRIPPGQLVQLVALITQCSQNLAPTTLTQAQHCQKVNAARVAAGQHNWMLCIQQMQHGH